MRTSQIAVVVAFIATLCGTASGQQIKKSTLSGTVMSNAVTIGVVGPVAFFTVPSSDAGRFLLTQGCVSGDPSSVVLRSAALGRLVVQEGCTTFEPGFSLAPGDTLECENFVGGAQTCVASGILSKK